MKSPLRPRRTNLLTNRLPRVPPRHHLPLHRHPHCPPPPPLLQDHVFSVTLENTTYNVFVRVRPNMHRFLAEVAKLFEVHYPPTSTYIRSARDISPRLAPLSPWLKWALRWRNTARRFHGLPGSLRRQVARHARHRTSHRPPPLPRCVRARGGQFCKGPGHAGPRPAPCAHPLAQRTTHTHTPQRHSQAHTQLHSAHTTHISLFFLTQALLLLRRLSWTTRHLRSPTTSTTAYPSSLGSANDPTTTSWRSCLSCVSLLGPMMCGRSSGRSTPWRSAATPHSPTDRCVAPKNTNTLPEVAADN